MGSCYLFAAVINDWIWMGYKCRSLRKKLPHPVYKSGLQSGLVSSDHKEFLEDLLACCNLLFLSLLSSSFVVLSRSCFCDDQVSVTLSFEFAVCVIKRVSW